MPALSRSCGNCPVCAAQLWAPCGWGTDFSCSTVYGAVRVCDKHLLTLWYLLCTSFAASPSRQQPDLHTGTITVLCALAAAACTCKRLPQGSAVPCHWLLCVCPSVVAGCVD